MKRSKLEELFRQLCKEDTSMILKSLSDMELKKILSVKDSVQFGGKLGTRAIGEKYGMSRMTVMRHFKKIKGIC